MAPLPADMPERVIAVSGLKGGIGKSTAAMFIAFVYAVVFGKRVLFVDADPSSQTGWDWWKTARDGGHPLPFDIECWAQPSVGELIADRTPGKYDVVIVDCGGHSDDVLRAAVSVATFALIVTTPNKADIRRLAATFQSAVKGAHDAGRADQVKAAVMFTRVDNRRPAANKKMRDQVAAKLPMLEHELSQIPTRYADAMCENVTDLADLEEAKLLVKEMEAL
uniref:ParA family protein n=1 Tax=Nonomuraea sp. CA-251285 TaxID=3240002 RepID=UPI003F495255